MNTEDRELLALAAKAAGYTILRFSQFDFIESCRIAVDGGWEASWNPLVNDGDALRLAVHLRMQVRFTDGAAYAETEYVRCSQPLDDDPYAATRRAIVRAAAAIGEQA